MAMIERWLARRALAACLALLAPTAALAQTEEHVAAVKAVQDKSPVRAGCAPVKEEFLGWPAGLVERCEYKQGETPGVAYVLDVKPETMARWIEAGCAAYMVGAASCFDRVLRCTVQNSGLEFVVGGNLVAERKGALQNMFYRNGVAIGAPQSGKPGAVAVEEQEKLAHTPEADVSAMPGRGGVAFWDTMPYQFAVKAIDLGVPAEMNTPDRRQKWLEIVRNEMLVSLGRDENRFLSGWMTAHPITLRTGDCPDARDP